MPCAKSVEHMKGKEKEKVEGGEVTETEEKGFKRMCRDRKEQQNGESQ